MDLSKVANLNDAAIATFDTFDQRKRFRSRTNLSRFHRELEERYGKPIKETELLATFKSLEDAGMGSLVVGRNKNDTRFLWNYSLRDVAKAAKGKLGQEELHKVIQPRRPGRPKGFSPKAQQQAPQAVKTDTPEVVDVMIIRHGVVQTVQLSKENESIFNDMLKVLQK